MRDAAPELRTLMLQLAETRRRLLDVANMVGWLGLLHPIVLAGCSC
jgi:hypothetical protein